MILNSNRILKKKTSHQISGTVASVYFIFFARYTLSTTLRSNTFMYGILNTINQSHLYFYFGIVFIYIETNGKRILKKCHYLREALCMHIFTAATGSHL